MPPPPPLTCGDVLLTPASDAEGTFTCLQRIEYLKNTRSFYEAAARQQVAGEFPEECGACAEISPSPPLPPQAPPEGTLHCEEVMEKFAGFYTCGDRIKYLEISKAVLTVQEARNVIAAEFPDPCGPCTAAPPPPNPPPLPPGAARTCEEVLQIFAGQFTCGARIDWLASNAFSEGAARVQVAHEFPEQCGPCGA